MEQNEVIQIKANEDGCIYLYNVATESWQKVCDIKTANEIPDSVKSKIQKMQRTTVS